jgi:hypothetical protein
MMSRYNRQKLKAHDRGQDRHNKGAAWLAKRERLRREVERQRSQRASKQK